MGGCVRLEFRAQLAKDATGGEDVTAIGLLALWTVERFAWRYEPEDSSVVARLRHEQALGFLPRDELWALWAVHDDDGPSDASTVRLPGQDLWH